MSETHLPLPVVALIRDLMFVGKVMATARAIACEVKVIRDPNLLPATGGRLLVVDLNLPGAIEAAVGWKNLQGGRAIGFVSHVDSAAIEAARAAGIDQVLARSAFTAQLESLLK